MHRISLSVGDYSGDGHCQEDTIYINCSVDRDELERAYKKSGIDVQSQCEEYEDRSFSRKMAIELLAKGKANEFTMESIQQDIKYFFDEGSDDEDDDGTDLYSTELFAVFWLCAARIGDPSINIEFVKINPPNINIGGYGLFW